VRRAVRQRPDHRSRPPRLQEGHQPRIKNRHRLRQRIEAKGRQFACEALSGFARQAAFIFHYRRALAPIFRVCSGGGTRRTSAPNVRRQDAEKAARPDQAADFTAALDMLVALKDFVGNDEDPFRLVADALRSLRLALRVFQKEASLE
jgi:hypothetical protein